jgi:hypothetical protein
MKLEYLIVCPPVIAEANFFEQILWQALTDNLNQVDFERLPGAVKIKMIRPCLPKTDDDGSVLKVIFRVLCGFDVELEDGIENIAAVIEDFSSAVASTDGVDHVLKFFDETILEQNLNFQRQLFKIEMKLRKALSLIYLSAYEDGFYDLLRDEKIEVLKKDGQPPGEADLRPAFENEFFHLLFSQYISLNERRLPKQTADLVQMLRDTESFDQLRRELIRRPVQIERDAGFLASLKSLLDPIEKLRNCVAHNRTPSKSSIEQFHKAAPELEKKLDDYLAEFEPMETAAEDDAATNAVEYAMENAKWDESAKTITLFDPDDDRIRSTVSNRKELEDYLRSVAEDAYYANAPGDSSDVAGTCWGDDYVQEALEPLEERLDKFFGPEDEEDAKT